MEAAVKLPSGFYLEWGCQFEHQARAQRTLAVVLPLVLCIIFLVLYLTFRDFPDTLLVFLAVPGAVAGGAIFQHLLPILGVDVTGNFSVAVWVGYLACFGLATETSIVMLVYLREGEFMLPMAAPILGGILVADEVIDLFIPVLLYWDRCRRLRRLRGTAAGERITVMEPSMGIQMLIQRVWRHAVVELGSMLFLVNRKAHTLHTPDRPESRAGPDRSRKARWSGQAKQARTLP